MADEIAAGGLSASLEARERYDAGLPVELRFSLVNRGDARVHVLTWATPLEGLRGPIFRVERQGERVPYQGIVVKRGDPPASAYETLAPGASIGAEVDLSKAYDLATPGAYTVELQTRLFDVMPGAETPPRSRDQLAPQPLSAPPVSFRIE